MSKGILCGWISQKRKNSVDGEWKCGNRLIAVVESVHSMQN